MLVTHVIFDLIYQISLRPMSSHSDSTISFLSSYFFMTQHKCHLGDWEACRLIFLLIYGETSLQESTRVSDRLTIKFVGKLFQNPNIGIN